MTAAGASTVTDIKGVEESNVSRVATSSLVNRTPKNGSRRPPLVLPRKTQPQESIVTDFCALPDRSLVEVVRGQDEVKSKLGFLIWNADKVSLVDRFEHAGKVCTPPALDEELWQQLNLRLPNGVKPCPTPEEFFIEVSDLIRSYVDLPESSLCLVAAFAISTWFVDQLHVAPYLWICGPPGSGKTTLLRLLHCLCRRSILIGGHIPAAVYSLPGLLHPTLLLDELRLDGTHQSHALQCWLRVGNARGVPVTVGGRLVDGFGAKVLCSRQLPSDSALASRAWHIPMMSSDQNVGTLSEEMMQQIGDDFQPRLLMFRLQHYREFLPDSIDLAPLNPRTRDMMRALLLPFWESKAVDSIMEALEEQLVRAEREKHHEPEALVIGVLVSFCHEEEFSEVFVGQIAVRVNANLRRFGEEADLKPRAVGAILKSLGLGTERLGGFGRGIRLTHPVRRRIHQLLRSYDLKALDSDSRDCAVCEELAPPTTAETLK